MRRFVQNAAPQLGLQIVGDIDRFFALGASQREASPLQAVFPAPSGQNRLPLTLNRPEQANGHVFLRPGQPLFDRLRSDFCEQYGAAALKGGVFIDPEAPRGYLFHLARLTIHRRAEESLAAFKREEVLESRLVGLTQERFEEGWGDPQPCPLERLLVLQSGESLSESNRLSLADASAGCERAWQALKRTARELIEGRRRVLADSLPDRREFLQRGYSYQESELAARRAKLQQKVQRGDPAARTRLERVKRQQRSLATLREAALAALQLEPHLIESGELKFLAHAWVSPSPHLEDWMFPQPETEAIAVKVARAFEEGEGAVVLDVSRPALAREAGLGDHPGFDLWSLRPDGRRAIEVKGRIAGGSVELTENEWMQACNHRERYWLYVVLDCAAPFPRLLRIQDPFGKLIARARGGVRFEERQLLEVAEREVFSGA